MVLIVCTRHMDLLKPRLTVDSHLAITTLQLHRHTRAFPLHIRPRRGHPTSIADAWYGHTLLGIGASN